MNETFTIGRDPACDITLADDSVSRLHANLTILGDVRPYLTDRGSANGIRITRRGVRSAIGGPEWLDEIERIEFGDVVIEIGDFGEMVRAAREARAGKGVAPQAGPPRLVPAHGVGEARPPQMRGVLDPVADPS